jgi:hypothetical protein
MEVLRSQSLDVKRISVPPSTFRSTPKRNSGSRSMKEGSRTEGRKVGRSRSTWSSSGKEVPPSYVSTLPGSSRSMPSVLAVNE